MSVRKARTGFTIVELLIVIVVIGILAATTIVAYSGIQRRALNAQRVAAAEGWQKIFIAYTVVNNKYPFTGLADFCLGTGNATDWDANPDEDCGWSNNIKHPNPAVNTALATVAALPTFPVAQLNIASPLYSGGIHMRSMETLDPAGVAKPAYPTLIYYLDGNDQDCTISPVIVTVSGGITISNSASSSGNDGPSTLCRIGLPDPSSL